MTATPSIKVVKQFNYRGVARKWSNRYHFNGGTPADAAHWTTFADSVVAHEKLMYENITGFSIVQVIGYAAGSDVPVFTKTYAQAGTGAFATWTACPGDVAGLVRYATAARTSKNHPVYLFNYYHSVGTDGSVSNADVWLPAQVTAASTYAGVWITGYNDGTNTYVRAGPNGATATGSLVETALTHRDFPRG